MKKKRKLGRKLLSFLLTLAMVMGLVPGMSLTAYADNVTNYDLSVGGIDVTSSNASNIVGDNTASYDATNNTLTLNGFTYNGIFPGILNNIDGLTVIISNTNTIGTYIVSMGSLNIKGNGTLKIEGTGGSAIHSQGDLTISESVNITADKSGTGIICGSKLTLESTGQINVKGSISGLKSVGGIEITNGNVTAEGGTSGIGDDGGVAPLVIGTNAKLIAIGGDKGAIYYDTDSNYRTVKNDIAGVAWTNKEGTTDGQIIAVSSGGQPISNIYKKVEFSDSHIHCFTYSATGATITATCSGTGCPLHSSPATLTLSATDTTYTGSAYSGASLTDTTAWTSAGLTVPTIKYAGRGDTSYTESATAPTAAGNYTANITVGGKTASVEYTIAKAPGTAPSSATVAGFTPNYTEETFTVGDNYEVSSAQSNTGVITDGSLTSAIDSAGHKVYIRAKETDDTQASAWLEVNLPSRPDAPTGLTSENATNGSTVDGKIKGTSALMEYKLKGSTNGWTDATATETDVKSGTYLVRVKATDSAPHGKETEVTVGSIYAALTEANKPTISVSDSHNPPVVDDTLTASTTATDIVYEWYRDGVKIPSATASTYTLTANDVGKAITVKATQTKKPDGTDYAEGSRPTQTSDATAAVVKKIGPAAPADEVAASFVINYSEETFTIATAYEVSATQSNTDVITDGSLTSAIDSEDHKIYIRAKETEDTQAGAWLAVTLSGRGSAPATLTTTNATNNGTADGKINNTNTYMEYKNKADNGEPAVWTTATQDATLVKPGTYLVRVKATSTSFRSAETEVTVGSKEIILADNQKPTAKAGLTYTGSEQVLLNATTGTLPEGATEMRYALGTDATTVPTDGWTTSIPTATEAGTYYVWYYVKGDENHIDSQKQCVTVTIKKKSGGGGGSTPTPTPTPKPSEDYTVPVENNSTMDISTKIKDGVAKITDINKEAVDEITNKDESDGGTESSDKITIDLSGAKQEVTGIDIGKESFKNLTNAVNNHDDITGIEIKLTDANVTLDARAASAITSQAKGDSIRLVVDGKSISALNAKQREAISNFSYKRPFEAYFESDGVRISDFKGGEATVAIKNDIPRGKDYRYFHLYYMPEEGDLTGYRTWYENEMFYFVTGHFSDYAIVYDETKRNDTLPEGFTRNTDGTITFTDPDLGEAIIADEVVREGTIYRMYNPNSGEHAYTKNLAEVAKNEQDGWKHEADADFATYEYTVDGMEPIFRVYNPVTGLHHYTSERGEVVILVKNHGFSFEGIAFFALPGDDEIGSQVYRLYNPYDSQHLYTISGGEYDVRGSEGWQKEGIAFNVK